MLCSEVRGHPTNFSAIRNAHRAVQRLCHMLALAPATRSVALAVALIGSTAPSVDFALLNCSMASPLSESQRIGLPAATTAAPFSCLLLLGVCPIYPWLRADPQVAVARLAPSMFWWRDPPTDYSSAGNCLPVSNSVMVAQLLLACSAASTISSL